MPVKTVIIFGSARGDGNTAKAITELSRFPEFELVELNALRIEPYRYEGPTEGDDFLTVARMMEAADHIVFATPVYWYAMSGVLKNFVDRLTDLLYAYKPIGKALKGKKVFLIASGFDEKLPEGFEVPFRLTAEYFGMTLEETFYKCVRPRTE